VNTKRLLCFISVSKLYVILPGSPTASIERPQMSLNLN